MTAVLLAWGRLLGPAGFARYSLVYSIAGVLSLPAGYGIGSATMRLLAERRVGDESGGLRMAVRWFSLVSGGLILLMLILTPPLRRVLEVPGAVYLAGVALAGGTSFYLFVEYILKGESLIRRLAWVRILNALAFTGILIIWYLVLPASFLGPIIGRGVPYLISGAIILLSVSSPLFRQEATRGKLAEDQWRGGDDDSLREPVKFLRFSLGACIASSASVFLLFADKLVLARVMTLREVGIYSGYFTGSYLLLSRGGEVLISVLFPGAVRRERESERAARLLLGIGTPGAFLVALAGVFVSFRLLGTQFDFSWALAALFSLGVSMYVVADARWWLIAGAEGIRGVARFGWNSVSIAVIVVIGMLVLPTVLGLYGAVLTLCAASLFSLVGSEWVSRTGRVKAISGITSDG